MDFVNGASLLMNLPTFLLKQKVHFYVSDRLTVASSTPIRPAKYSGGWKSSAGLTPSGRRLREPSHAGC
jgi:hypothetical protein